MEPTKERDDDVEIRAETADCLRLIAQEFEEELIWFA
jgi:hypothetical protein